MKRLFYQTKMYDYTSLEEAERDIIEMRKKGWIQKDEIAKIDNYKFKYSVEYYKEM